jgi:hypothetical protein
MTASSLPLRGAVVRLHHLARCAPKPGPIAGSQLCTRKACRELYDIFCNLVGSIRSSLLANMYLRELDRYMECDTALSGYERHTRKRHQQANFLYIRDADDFRVLCDGTKAQATALRQELHQFLQTERNLELSLEKTKVSPIHEGFELLGYVIDRPITGPGTWAPRIRIPARALERIRQKVRAALDPRTHGDSGRTKILGLNRIIGGWCRYDQTTSSPSQYFGKLHHAVFWFMAHWLGRKYQVSIPEVLRRFRKGTTCGTHSTSLIMPREFKAKRHPLKAQANPSISATAPLREAFDALEEAWVGTEDRQGQADRRDVVYERDHGICGLCGKLVTWKEAILDHKIPRHRFKPLKNAEDPDNLWILHVEPCHRMKTTRDLQSGGRVR